MDAIVAGAGIWGCTLARRLAEAGRKVLVLEKRAAVGGNCRCETDPETGIEVHTYGSHIFHTKNEKVWAFVNRFVRFNDYRHCVLANHAGKIYHLPFGRTLYDEFFGKGKYELPLNDRQNAAIFDAFIKHYTAKQWGMDAEKVDPAVIKRLKVRDNYSTDYFDDPHQGIPIEGYNALFERLLDHPNIEVLFNVAVALRRSAGSSSSGSHREYAVSLRTPLAPASQLAVARGIPDFRSDRLAQLDENTLAQVPIYYSGPIDAWFDYKFGALPWRTLNFELETLNCSDYQGNSVVNYPDIDVPYTRIHEFKHYHPERKAEVEGVGRQRTIIMREFSKTWNLGDEPYYPISNPESAALLAKYQEEVEKFNHRCTPTPKSYASLTIGGRLGGYRYYDMDQAVAAALEVPLG